MTEPKSRKLLKNQKSEYKYILALYEGKVPLECVDGVCFLIFDTEINKQQQNVKRYFIIFKSCIIFVNII